MEPFTSNNPTSNFNIPFGGNDGMDDDATTIAPSTDRNEHDYDDASADDNDDAPDMPNTNQNGSGDGDLSRMGVAASAAMAQPQPQSNFVWTEARTSFIRELGTTPVFEAMKDTLTKILKESDTLYDTPFPAIILSMRAAEQEFLFAQKACSKLAVEDGAATTFSPRGTPNPQPVDDCKAVANELVGEDMTTNVIFSRGAEGACCGWKHFMRYVDPNIVRAWRRRLDDLRGPWSSSLTQKSQSQDDGDGDEFDIRIISGVGGAYLSAPRLARSPSSVKIMSYYILTGPTKDGAATVFANFVTSDVIRAHDAMKKTHASVGLLICFPFCERLWTPSNIAKHTERCCTEIAEATLVGGSIVYQVVVNMSGERLVAGGTAVTWTEKEYMCVWRKSKGKSKKTKKKDKDGERDSMNTRPLPPTRLMSTSPADLFLRGIFYEGVDAVQCHEHVDEKILDGGLTCTHSKTVRQFLLDKIKYEWKCGNVYEAYESILELTLLDRELDSDADSDAPSDSRLAALHYFLSHSVATDIRACELACKNAVAALDGLEAATRDLSLSSENVVLDGYLAVSMQAFFLLRHAIVEARRSAKSYIDPFYARIAALMNTCIAPDPSIAWDNLELNVMLKPTTTAHSSLKKLLAIFRVLTIEVSDAVHRILPEMVDFVSTTLHDSDTGSSNIDADNDYLVLSLAEAEKDMINRRVAPPPFARNCSLLQYAVDVGIDVALSDICFEITAANDDDGEDEAMQFAIAMRILHKQSARIQGWNASNAVIMKNVFRQPSLVNPVTCVYQMGSDSSVFGYRGITALAEPDAIEYLRKNMSVFFKSSASLSPIAPPHNAYEVACATCVIGSTLLAGAVSRFVPQVEIQADHFLQGPDIDGAQNAFAATVIADIASIMSNDDGHVVISLETVVPPISVEYPPRLSKFGPSVLNTTADDIEGDPHGVLSMVSKAVKVAEASSRVTLIAFANVDDKTYVAIKKQYVFHYVDTRQLHAADQLVFSSPLNPHTLYLGLWTNQEEADLVMSHCLKKSKLPELSSDLSDFLLKYQWDAENKAFSALFSEGRRLLLLSSVVPGGPLPDVVAESVRFLQSDCEILMYLATVGEMICEIIGLCHNRSPYEPSLSDNDNVDGDLSVWREVFEEDIVWRMIATFVDRLSRYLRRPAVAMSAPLARLIKSMIERLRDASRAVDVSVLPRNGSESEVAGRNHNPKSSRKKKAVQVQSKPVSLTPSESGGSKVYSALSDLQAVVSALSAVLDQTFEWACRTSITQVGDE